MLYRVRLFVFVLLMAPATHAALGKQSTPALQWDAESEQELRQEQEGALLAVKPESVMVIPPRTGNYITVHAKWTLLEALGPETGICPDPEEADRIISGLYRGLIETAVKAGAFNQVSSYPVGFSFYWPELVETGFVPYGWVKLHYTMTYISNQEWEPGSRDGGKLSLSTPLEVGLADKLVMSGRLTLVVEVRETYTKPNKKKLLERVMPMVRRVLSKEPSSTFRGTSGTGLAVYIPEGVDRRLLESWGFFGGLVLWDLRIEQITR